MACCRGHAGDHAQTSTGSSDHEGDIEECTCIRPPSDSSKGAPQPANLGSGPDFPTALLPEVLEPVGSVTGPPEFLTIARPLEVPPRAPPWAADLGRAPPYGFVHPR